MPCTVAVSAPPASRPPVIGPRVSEPTVMPSRSRTWLVMSVIRCCWSTVGVLGRHAAFRARRAAAAHPATVRAAPGSRQAPTPAADPGPPRPSEPGRRRVAVPARRAGHGSARSTRSRGARRRASSRPMPACGRGSGTSIPRRSSKRHPCRSGGARRGGCR